ncbi:ATP-binding cassette domain-containing protein, partial [Methanoregula sp.]|uniref:ATP-binding cassette domain-containing protein n=1 Tax=Methanoregula sp. TaxID=2052170 RepID=UPI003C7969E7
NLNLHGLLYDMPPDLRKQRIAEVLSLVDLTGRKDDLVKKYSGGMRRRLELARGLMHHPKILFLDEPTLGLDPQTREHIWAYVKKLAFEKNITIIITTHYMDEADRLCNRIGIVDAGKIAVLGTPKELKQAVGGDVIFLKAKACDVESLQALPFVKGVRSDDEGILITVQDAGLHLQEILEKAGPVAFVEVRPMTLENVFLHHTGRAIREGSPEGSWAEKAMMAGSRR